MEYYSVEPLIFHCVDPDPFSDVSNLKRIQITETQTVRTIIHLGTKYFREGTSVSFAAIGRDCSKAVTCAEILKSNSKKTVHQTTHVKKMT
jgi:hypothetical protein